MLDSSLLQKYIDKKFIFTTLTSVQFYSSLTPSAFCLCCLQCPPPSPTPSINPPTCMHNLPSEVSSHSSWWCPSSDLMRHMYLSLLPGEIRYILLLLRQRPYSCIWFWASEGKKNDVSCLFVYPRSQEGFHSVQSKVCVIIDGLE